MVHARTRQQSRTWSVLYLPDESPDGIAWQEGIFLLCRFWLVDNLAMSSPVDLDGYAVIEVLSASGNLREAAQHLFAALRLLDGLSLNHLYAEPCDEQGLGLAIMDRLRRCAAPLQSEVHT